MLCFRQILVVPFSGSDECLHLTKVDCHKLHIRRALDTLVKMMPRLPNMRFTWSDVNLLQLWWERWVTLCVSLVGGECRSVWWEVDVSLMGGKCLS